MDQGEHHSKLRFNRRLSILARHIAILIRISLANYFDSTATIDLNIKDNDKFKYYCYETTTLFQPFLI